MNALMILAILLLSLFLLGQVRVGGQVEYGTEGVRVWVRMGRLRIKILPHEKRYRKKTSSKKEKKPKKVEETPLQQIGGALDYAQALLPITLEAAGQFNRKLQVDKLVLKLTVGGTDPADIALRYGQAGAVLGAFWYPLTQGFHVKDGRANVNLDFDAPTSTLYVWASLSLKLGQILRLGIYFGIRALRAFLAVRRRQKQ